MMESSIVGFHQDFYIPEIQKLAFHLPHVRILGTHHCGNTIREVFKNCLSFQYVLCYFNYVERVVAIFGRLIQYKYYGGNSSVSIEGIPLEHFSYTDQKTSLSYLHSRT